MPLISVIVPTFNRQKLILRTLDSVFDQSIEDFEILVIDNCSNDSTVRVIEERKYDHRLRVFVNKRNMERAYSRNRGIEMAAGAFITFLDSDDILYPTVFERLLSDINKLGDLDLFVYKYNFITEAGVTIRTVKYPSSWSTLNHLLAHGNYLSNIAWFVRRERLSFLRYSLDPALIGIEDYEFNLRMTKNITNSILIDFVGAGVTHHHNRSTFEEEFGRVKARTLKMLELASTTKDYFIDTGNIKYLANALFCFLAKHSHHGNTVIELFTEIRQRSPVHIDLKIFHCVAVMYARRLKRFLRIKI